MGIEACIAETYEEVNYLRASQIQSFINLQTGNPGKLPNPIKNIEQHIPANLLSAANELYHAWSPEMLKEYIRNSQI